MSHVQALDCTKFNHGYQQSERRKKEKLCECGSFHRCNVLLILTSFTQQVFLQKRQTPLPIMINVQCYKVHKILIRGKLGWTMSEIQTRIAHSSQIGQTSAAVLYTLQPFYQFWLLNWLRKTNQGHYLCVFSIQIGVPSSLFQSVLKQMCNRTQMKISQMAAKL